jgi:hypothetical protein
VTVDSISSRKRVAREEANLRYYGAEKEHKQAKLKAAKHSGFILSQQTLKSMDRSGDSCFSMEPFLGFSILACAKATDDYRMKVYS